MYYLRTRPAANAIQFTIDQKVVMEARQKQQQQKEEEDKEHQEKVLACSLQNREACIMCSAWRSTGRYVTSTRLDVWSIVT